MSADVVSAFLLGMSVAFIIGNVLSRNEHDEWQRITDRLIALIEKQQENAEDDADWWKRQHGCDNE